MDRGGEEMTRFLSIFSVSLIIGVVLTIGIAKIVSHTNAPVSETESVKSKDQTEKVAKDKTANQQNNSVKTTTNPEAQIFVKATCITCHSVSKYGLDGGKQGPDLTKPMMGTVIKDKYGMKLRDYLDNPKSPVMAGVLGNLKLTGEQKDKISKLLTEE
jgi:hypothetical protein